MIERGEENSDGTSGEGSDDYDTDEYEREYAELYEQRKLDEAADNSSEEDLGFDHSEV
jgi:hypothetical protein